MLYYKSVLRVLADILSCCKISQTKIRVSINGIHYVFDIHTLIGLDGCNGHIARDCAVSCMSALFSHKSLVKTYCVFLKLSFALVIIDSLTKTGAYNTGGNCKNQNTENADTHGNQTPNNRNWSDLGKLAWVSYIS